MGAGTAADPIIPIDPNTAADPVGPLPTPAVAPPAPPPVAFADIGGMGRVMLAVALAMDPLISLTEEKSAGPIGRVAVGMIGLGSNGAMVRQ